MNQRKTCRPGDPNCTPGATLADRTDAIVRSIASGNNACGSLLAADGRVNEAFIAKSVRPTLEVYEQEAEQLRQDRARVSQESEARRQTLEFIRANVQLPREIASRVNQVLGHAN